MENFIVECARTGVLFRNLEIHQGSNRLVHLIDNIPLVLSSLPSECIPQANATLAEALNAFEQQDFVTLADVLSHKLPTLIFHGLHGKSAPADDAVENPAAIKPLEDEFILNALLNSQAEKLKSTYSTNISRLKECNYHGKLPSYEDLTTLFVGNSEPEPDTTFTFYAQDVGFDGKEYERAPDKKLALNKIPRGEFGDCLLVGSWNIFDIYAFVQDAKQKGKKAYIGISDTQKFFASLQGITIQPHLLSGAVIFDTAEAMKEYFATTEHYLPKHIIGPDSSNSLWLQAIEDVHGRRINSEGNTGKRNNVILSIAIPTYNRGKRALDSVLWHLDTCYDEEIEIVVSNNGTKNETKSYYDEIAQISDSRLNYHEFDENQGFALNCCKVCEMASGQYVLFMSDEDLIDLDNLPQILNVLGSDDNIAVVRTSTLSQGKAPHLGRFRAGKEALISFMLTSNYISGNIFNTRLIQQSRSLDFVRSNLENEVCFFYPHMVWELFLSQYSDMIGLDTILIREGKAEKQDMGDSEVGKGSKTTMPTYATIESRLKQHAGFLNIFKSMHVWNNDFALLRQMYVKLCSKTIFLVRLSSRVYYSNTDIEIEEIMEMIREKFNHGLDEVYALRQNYAHKDHLESYATDLELIDGLF